MIKEPLTPTLPHKERGDEKKEKFLIVQLKDYFSLPLP